MLCARAATRLTAGATRRATQHTKPSSANRDETAAVMKCAHAWRQQQPASCLEPHGTGGALPPCPCVNASKKGPLPIACCTHVVKRAVQWAQPWCTLAASAQLPCRGRAGSYQTYSGCCTSKTPVMRPRLAAPAPPKNTPSGARGSARGAVRSRAWGPHRAASAPVYQPRLGTRAEWQPVWPPAHHRAHSIRICRRPRRPKSGGTCPQPEQPTCLLPGPRSSPARRIRCFATGGRAPQPQQPSLLMRCCSARMRYHWQCIISTPIY